MVRKAILDSVGNKVTVTFVSDLLGKMPPEVTVTCYYQYCLLFIVFSNVLAACQATESRVTPPTIENERWENDMLHLLDVIAGNDFEVVDTPVLMGSPSSGEVR